MVFDIKIKDFWQFWHKNLLVTSGHMINSPVTITYVNVVSRETVHIALIIAASNDLKVKAVDILNAYVQAPVVEQVRTKFGNDASNVALIVWAMYRLKSASVAFRSHFATCPQTTWHEENQMQ